MSDQRHASRLFRVLALTGAAALAARAEAAGPHESFAIVSRLGDTISIVAYQPTTGTSLDRNTSTRVQLGDGHFDDLAARAAARGLRRADPESDARVVKLADRATSDDDGEARAGQAASPALLAAVAPLLGSAAPHYLVVVDKWRGDAHLKTDRGFIGSGKLSGLGFYLDGYHGMRNRTTGERGRGYIAPFAYLQVELIDLATGTVVRAAAASEASTRANVGPGSDLDPWNALSAEEKVRLLDGMVARAVETAITRVVATE